MNDPKYIILHHSYSDDDKTRNFDALKRYHISKGWKDIGYHFVCEKVKETIEVIPGRPITMIGSHTLGFNNKSVGICMVGNYDIQQPTLSMMTVVLKLIRRIQGVFDIPTENVLGHRETYVLREVPREKWCPGNMIFMSDIREALKYEG